jgi:hypothetical protein
VNLQAGTTGVVIPGVTQATSYVPEEVEDLGDQTVTWQDIPVVIDQETFNRYSGIITLQDGWVAPTYEVQELDGEGYIDGIDITGNGNIPSSDIVAHMTDNMFAAPAGSSIDPQTFDANVWVAIPFYVKCRAGEIETIGGGGNGNQLVSNNEEYTATLNDDGELNIQNGSFVAWSDIGDGYSTTMTPDGIDLVWNGEDTGSIGKGPAGWSLNSGTNKSLFVNTNGGDSTWEFTSAGGLKFPDNSTQTTAYTGQVGTGSAGWALLYGGNKMGVGGERNWQDFDGSCTDGAGNTYFYGGTYPFSQNMSSSYNPFIAKVNSEGTVVWTTVIYDYYGRAVAAQYFKFGNEFIILFTEDETDQVTTKQWSYNVNITDGSLTNPSYTIPDQSGVGVILKDAWTVEQQGSSIMDGWAGYTTNENRVITLTGIINPNVGSFTIPKANVPGLTDTNYSSCFIDSTIPIYSITDQTSDWLIDTDDMTDYTTGTHTIQIPQSTNATLGVASVGPGGWITVGTAGNTHEYYTSSASDIGNSVFYAVGYGETGGSIVSCINYSMTADWHKNINLSETYLYLSGVAVYDGYVYTVGDNDNGAGIVTKLDSTGAIIWQRKLTNDGPFGWQEFSIAIGTNGEIIVAASYSGIDNPAGNIFIIRFNASGDVVWQRDLGTDWADYPGSDWESDGWDTGGTRFLSADDTSFYLALSVRNANGPNEDAAAVKLPLDGSGVGSWGSGNGIWIYTEKEFTVSTVDISDGSSAITDLIVSNFTTTSGSGSTPSVYTDIQSQVTTTIGTSTFLGIARAQVDSGSTTTTLDATQNGKFIYFYGTGGVSTIFVPNNDNVQLPVGYTVTLVLDDFDGNSVAINTDGDTSSGLRINATGFTDSAASSNYWYIGGDGKIGIYTLMKVDTNRWILSGPTVGID